MRRVDVEVIASMLVGLAFWVVPAHVTSLWMDWEFSGWVIPVANRLAHGPRLYTDGAHIPLPPLSFVVAFLASLGHGVWLTESVLDYLFRSLILVVAYFGLAAYLPWPLPFVATLITLPMYVAFPKMILYDSCTQALVAVLAVVAVRRLVPPRGDVPATPRSPAAIAVPIGALAALTILSKQSTGLGATLGVVLLAWLATASRPLRERATVLAILLLVVPIAVGIGLAAMSPLASPAGFFADVFGAAMAAKGGQTALSSSLYAAVGPLVVVTAFAYLIGAALATGARAAVDSGYAVRGGALLAAAAIATAVLSLAAMFGPPAWHFWWTAPTSIVVTKTLLEPSLTATAALTGIVVAGWTVGPPTGSATEALAAFAIVLLPAAIMHGLSIALPLMRLNYDTNPFTIVEVAVPLVILTVPVRRAPAVARATRLVVATALVVALGFAAEDRLRVEMGVVKRCTESWPEVAHLAGARLRPEASGMRDLVQRVRVAAKPDETVLLLPDDPNVAAWFERPRPPVGSAILFADQYGDRYVDDDFARLQASPPKVIVIGPRSYWEKASGWNPSVSHLVGRVRTELLPGRYRSSSAPITFHNREDYMDVFVRTDDAPPAPAPVGSAG